MPIITIQMLDGRSPSLKQQLIAEVSHAVRKTLDVPLDRIRVILQEIPDINYGVAGKPIREYRQETPEQP